MATVTKIRAMSRPRAEKTSPPEAPAAAHREALFNISTHLEECGGVLQGIEQGLGLILGSTPPAEPESLISILRDRLCQEIKALDEQTKAAYALVRVVA